MQQRYHLNERFVWWSSPDFNNYFMQKKTSHQMYLGVLVPFIIILAFTTYSCSNLFVSFTVFVTHVQAMAHVLAILAWLGWHIDLLNFLLYLFALVIVAQYTIVSGVAHRFSPHADLKMSIEWSSTTFGGLMMTFCLISTAAAAPLFLATHLDMFNRLGTIIILANLVGYVAAAVYLPSLMLFLSLGIFGKFSMIQSITFSTSPRWSDRSGGGGRGGRGEHDRHNARHRHYMSRHLSSSSFSPSNFYSHAATGKSLWLN